MPLPVREYGGYSPQRSCDREHEVLWLSAEGECAGRRIGEDLACAHRAGAGVRPTDGTGGSASTDRIHNIQGAMVPMPLPVREYGGGSPQRSCEREHEVLRLSAAGAHSELKQAKGGEEMNETEKRAAEELVLSMKTVPHDAEDYIRG